MIMGFLLLATGLGTLPNIFSSVPEAAWRHGCHFEEGIL